MAQSMCRLGVIKIQIKTQHKENIYNDDYKVVCYIDFGTKMNNSLLHLLNNAAHFIFPSFGSIQLLVEAQ